MVRILGKPFQNYPDLKLGEENGLESFFKHIKDANHEEALDLVGQAAHYSTFNLIPYNVDLSEHDGDSDLVAAIAGAWSTDDIEFLEFVANLLSQIRQEREKLEEALSLLTKTTHRLERIIHRLASSLEED